MQDKVERATRTVRLTRRAFLQVGALAGGGLSLGFMLPAVAKDASSSSESAAKATAEFAPNAWIHIYSSGRTRLVLARSEMGQGVMTALPTLIAEELEVGLDQIEVEFAGADPVFVNALLGTQATGGGTSIRDAWLGLREAGASARRLLISAAATIWGVPESECRASRARVWHADGRRMLTYGKLAAVAARLPAPAPGDLKSAEDWSLIGTPQRRLDSPKKVAGKATFGLDVRLPQMLYASIERCALLEGRLKDWDGEAAARKVPGVVDILQQRDGVAVVATSTWAALRARELLKLNCGPSTLTAHADHGRLQARFQRALTGRAAVAHRVSNVSLALDASASQIKAVYEVPFQAHACMEPMNCTADVSSNRCVIYAPTQDQGGVLDKAMRVTRLSPNRIEVHTTMLGGGYGRRLEQDFVEEAVELSLKFRRPVQVVWTRADDFEGDFFRPMTMHRLRGGLDADGRLVAWFHRIVGPSIAARVRPSVIDDGIDPMMVEGAADLPYPIPNQRIEFRRADIPVPVGQWYGGGYAQNAFVVECFLDELARTAGKDPLQFRREALDGSERHIRVLDLLAERSAWDTPPPEGRTRGVALVAAYGSLIAQVAEVSIQEQRVKVHRVVCVVDCGYAVNPDTVRTLTQGGVAFGLTACLKSSVTLSQGRVEQRSFKDFPLLRFDEMPDVEVHLVPSKMEPGGVDGLAAAAIVPAVANAVAAARGEPVRSLPIRLS